MSSRAPTCRRCGHTLDADGACIACGATVLATPTEPERPQGKKGDSDPLIGRDVIGQYVIRRRIGDGGMGAVYLAEQAAVGRDAAIKILHPQLGASPELAERFQHEARAVSQLNHPNIVTIYNFGTMDDGTPFLAMEYLDGTTLQQLLARSRAVPAERAVRIAIQIAQSLNEAHRNGIVHRDLKPQNVMLVERAQQTDFVKVLDFGIAKVQGVNMTADGLLCGTPRYMSPEQLKGAAIDGRSDLYSLGVVLFEMLAGRTPFEADSVLGFMEQHVNTAPPTLSDVARRKKVPPALEDLVRRLLAKNPAERPKSAAAVADELARALDPERSIVAAPGARPLAATTTSGAAAGRGAGALARRAWARLVALARAVVRGLRLGWSASIGGLRARIQRRRGWRERLGLRKSPAARAKSRLRRTWQASRRWASSVVRRLRKR